MHSFPVEWGVIEDVLWSPDVWFYLQKKLLACFTTCLMIWPVLFHALHVVLIQTCINTQTDILYIVRNIQTDRKYDPCCYKLDLSFTINKRKSSKGPCSWYKRYLQVFDFSLLNNVCFMVSLLSINIWCSVKLEHNTTSIFCETNTITIMHSV